MAARAISPYDTVSEASATRPSVCAYDDIERSGQRTRLDLLTWSKLDKEHPPILEAGNRAEQRVMLVAGLACDVHLRGQQFYSGGPELEVDVRRAAGIGHGTDGPEPIAPSRVGDRPSVALEPGILLRALRSRGWR
jgi:hypothetical protein